MAAAIRSSATPQRDDRLFPGDVEQFYTGGGLHYFRNFDKNSDRQIMTVETAFHNSVNLVFIRMMRDIAHYYMFGPASEGSAMRLDAAIVIPLIVLIAAAAVAVWLLSGSWLVG